MLSLKAVPPPAPTLSPRSLVKNRAFEIITEITEITKITKNERNSGGLGLVPRTP
jgi:hypothetical protein